MELPIMKNTINLLVLGLLSLSTVSEAQTVKKWELKLTYESKSLVKSPFFMNTTADLDKNGLRELIVTDFGKFGNHIEEWKQWRKKTSNYNLFVLEWSRNELQTKLQKTWDTSGLRSDEERQYFQGYDANQAVVWEKGTRGIVETIPPYLGLEWKNGKYILLEQQGSSQQKPLVGSWYFPWISPSCYNGFQSKPTWPRECLLGIRDLWGNGNPKLVTIFEEELPFKQHKQTIRVRKFDEKFPVEWEMSLSSIREAVWWQRGDEYVFADRLNLRATMGLPITILAALNNYLLVADKVDGGYKLLPLKANLRGEDKKITSFDLMDIYLRKTKNKDTEEFWGYRRIERHDPKSLNFILELRNARLKDDLTGFEVENVDFPHNDSHLGVGYFDIQDIDGDGIDEIILVEETAGVLKFSAENVYFGDIRDYIHILKWNGTKYQTMWVSPPYTKRGTKFLVEDIKNIGKKQLVVLSPYGTIQIWERQ
jgi:hypothetical protein